VAMLVVVLDILDGVADQRRVRWGGWKGAEG